MNLLKKLVRRIPNDGEPLSDVYNSELDKLIKKNKGTWLMVPWLYSEYGIFKPVFFWCYLHDVSRCYLSVRILYLVSTPSHSET